MGRFFFTTILFMVFNYVAGPSSIGSHKWINEITKKKKKKKSRSSGSSSSSNRVRSRNGRLIGDFSSSRSTRSRNNDSGSSLVLYRTASSSSKSTTSKIGCSCLQLHQPSSWSSLSSFLLSPLSVGWACWPGDPEGSMLGPAEGTKDWQKA